MAVHNKLDLQKSAEDSCVDLKVNPFHRPLSEILYTNSKKSRTLFGKK